MTDFPQMPKPPQPITVDTLGRRPMGSVTSNDYAGWAIGVGLIAIADAIVRAAEVIAESQGESLR
jgi:hypothetical protein